MTKNVFQALDFISREGLDNSQWGLESNCSGVSPAEMFPVVRGTWGNISCPQSFLYIWVDLETADRLGRLGLQPTWTMYVVSDDEDYKEVIFIWELRAED